MKTKSRANNYVTYIMTGMQAFPNPKGGFQLSRIKNKDINYSRKKAEALLAFTKK